MAIKQLSVFAENKRGSVYETLNTLADAHIDVRALSIADTMDFGILRLIVSDLDKAVDLLKSKGTVISVTDVIGVQMPNVPGGLAKILALLAEKNVNIEYLYAFIATVKENAYVVLRVADNDAAEKVLKDAGLVLLTDDAIHNL